MIRILLLLRRPLEHRFAPIVIAIFASLLALPSVFGGFAADDHFLRMVSLGFPGMEELAGRHALDTFVFADGTLERNDLFRERGLLPWWSTPEARLAFWRPVASITHYVDFKFLGDNAWLMHVQNLFWYAILTLVLCALYRRIIGAGWIAVFATLLYAIDDAHGMPIGWISNRNALLCMIFGVTTLIMHDKWRRSGQWWALPIGLVSFLLGLLSGEATLAITGYIFGHALFMDRSGWFRGMLSLIPYGIVIVPWRIVYQQMEYGATGSGMYLDPVRETGLFLNALVHRMPVLLNSQMFYPPATISLWAPPHIQALHAIISIQVLLFIAWVFLPMLRHSNSARVWMVGMIIAVLPVCATFPMDRLLFFVGIGGMGLVAQFLGGLAGAHKDRLRTPWVSSRSGWRFRASLVAFGFILVHIIVSPFSVPVRSMTMMFTGQSLERAVSSLPMDESLTEKDVILVTVPSDFDAWHVPVMRSSMGQPVPRRTLALAVGPFPTEVRRLDAYTLEIRPDETFVPKPWGSMFRGSTPPFQEGEIIEVGDMTVEIVRVSPFEKLPMVARFTFKEPLESESKLWFNYQRDQYVPWQVPEVGEIVVLPGPFMFGLSARAS